VYDTFVSGFSDLLAKCSHVAARDFVPAAIMRVFLLALVLFITPLFSHAATQATVHSLEYPTPSTDYAVLSIDNPGSFDNSTSTHFVMALRSIPSGTIQSWYYQTPSDLSPFCKGTLGSNGSWVTSSGSSTLSFNLSNTFFNGSYDGPYSVTTDCSSPGIYYVVFGYRYSTDLYYVPVYWTGSSLRETETSDYVVDFPDP